jgi:molybdate transport system regulatory protein
MPSGAARSGARLTEAGCRILAHYRAIEHQVAKAEQSADWAALDAALLPSPRDHQ